MYDIDMVRQIAEAQHGLVAVRQLNSLAGEERRRTLRNRLGLVPLSTTVMRLAGAPTTALQRSMAAVLDAPAGSVLSHDSAASQWSLGWFPEFPIHVTGTRDLKGRDTPYLSVLHQPRLLLAEHITVLDGVPITTPARTLFDLATVGHHPKRVERALDTAWANGLVDLPTMIRIVAQLAHRGRRGSTLMRRLVDDRAENYRPMESGLEFRFRELMAEISVTMESQVDVGDGETWLGRIDFAIVRLRYLVQIDSERYHSALIDQRRDQEQTERLEAAGWLVRRFTDIDVWHRGGEVKRIVLADLNPRWAELVGSSWGYAHELPTSSISSRG